MRWVIYAIAVVVLSGSLLRPYHLAVALVPVTGEGLETREVVPEHRRTIYETPPRHEEYDEAGRRRPEVPTIKPREIVEPPKMVTKPRLARRVEADLGRHWMWSDVQPKLENVRSPIDARADWGRMFAEVAVILWCATGLLGLERRRRNARAC